MVFSRRRAAASRPPPPSPAAPPPAQGETIPPELLRRVRQIEIRSRRLVNQIFGANYHSVFRGRGMEFVDVREYQPGDEVRTIDWNVTARMGEAFVKRYTEERDLTVMLLVDLSASQGFGAARHTKREVLAEIGAVLALAAVRHNDKVGLITFTDRIESVVPAKKGLRHALRIVRELLYQQPRGQGTDIAAAVQYVANILHRRSIVFLMSDFLEAGSGFTRVLRVAARRHELIAVTAVDPHELALPRAGLIEVEDAETGASVIIDTSSARVRRAFAEQAERLTAERHAALRAARVDAVDVRTDQPYSEPLLAYFRRRAHVLAAGGAAHFSKTSRAG